MNGPGCIDGGKVVHHNMSRGRLQTTRTYRRKVMAKDVQKNTYKKFITLLVGFFILILGITLILTWWADVAILLKGSIGMILALGGLLALYTLNK